MGVRRRTAGMDLSNGRWVPLFLNAVGELQLRREGYLVTLAASGEIACKACGRYLPPGDARKHFKGHIAELDRYLDKKRVLDTQARKAPPKERVFMSDAEILEELGL